MSLSNGEQGTRLKGCITLVALTVAQIVFSGLATFWLSHTYGLGRRVILLHVAIVAVLFATIVLLLGWSLMLRAVRESSLARRLFLLIPGAASGFLAFLYVGDYIGNFWGRNLNYVLVLAQAQAVMRGGGIVRISTPLYLALGAYLAVFILGYQFVCSRYWTGLEFLWFTSSQLGVLRRAARRGIYVVGLSWIAIFGYLSSVWNTPTGYLVPQYEPVTSFFVSVFPDPPAMSGTAASSFAQKASYVAPGPFDRRNVILITIDSARADHFQTYGYARPTSPFLTDLARDGTLRKVEMALSTCSESVCGIKSTLTSQPYDGFSDNNVSLQDLFRAVGYKTYFVLSGLHDWYGLKQFYGTQSDLIFDGTQTKRYAGGDDRLLFEGLEEVPVYDGRPAFFSFHLMSSHDAGFRQDAFRVYEPSSNELWRILFSRQEPESFINGYDNGLTQADAIVRELFDVLKEKGYLDRSLVVILSDHGEAMGERGPNHHFGHIDALYQEYVHIPLFIYDDPSVEYGNLKFATQLDVAPTIVERLGLPVPPSWQGRSLLRPEPDARYTFHQTTNAQPVRMVVFRTSDATYKYMRAQETEELYEIISDPLEQTNLVTTVRPEVLRDLRDRLSAYIGGAS